MLTSATNSMKAHKIKMLCVHQGFPSKPLAMIFLIVVAQLCFSNS